MKYVVTFKIPVSNNEKRYYALSAVDKADYIKNCIIRCGEKVEIVSASESTINENYKGRVDSIDENCKVITSPSPSGGTKIKDRWASFCTQVWLLFYLLKYCKNGERILVYHKIINVPVLLLALFFKNLKIILEVEEIYTQLYTSNWRKKLEWKIFEKAESYIFASMQLQEQINTKGKPYVIANGKYEVAPIVSKPVNDGRTHLVYAGLIADGKVAFKSAGMAEYLSNKYCIHVIGYGKDEDITKLKKYISALSLPNQAEVRYEGLKRGVEYDSFLQSCHFGLCPISSDVGYQNACFPSKVTSYLSNGLRVVVTENNVIRSSAYGDVVLFSKDDSALEMAKTVEGAAKEETVDIRARIQVLDTEFIHLLKKII